MAPQTLPPAERELYENIKKQYKVAFEPLKVKDYQIQLLKITDWEKILQGKNPLQDVSAFPFWIRLWEAAIVLADLMASLPHSQETTVLELGAGLGAPGLIAAAAGFQVTLSDYEELILDFERVNAAASKLENVQFLMLDWLKPTQIPQYDLIIGAEVLFREEFFQPLLQILHSALKPQGLIYLAHDSNRQSLQPFLKMAEKEFTIGVSSRMLKSLDQDKNILLTRLKRRA